VSTPAPAGTPVVFVNAFPVDRAQWDPLIAILVETYRDLGDIITFDVPGIGDMPLIDEEPGLELIADGAVAAMREVTGRDAAIWIGCSMGGYIAMAIAERDADAVAGLGLLGTRSTADDDAGVAKRLGIAAALEGKPGVDDPRAMGEGLVGTRGSEREGLVNRVAANIARHSGDGIAWGQRAMAARPDRTEVLRGLDVPAVVVRGKHDAVVSLEDARTMASALGVEPVELAGVGHLSALEDPKGVAAALAPLFAAAR
jgi:pimeloyl-ACP methyl ester carboxylesterase